MESLPSSTTDEHRSDVTAKSDEEHDVTAKSDEEHEKHNSGSSEDSCESDVSEGDKGPIRSWDEELREHYVRTSSEHGQQTNEPTRHGSEDHEGKKRHRRIKGGRHHRRYNQKPYSRMCNRPQAPRNTTQFIINDHLGNSSPQLEIKEDGDLDKVRREEFNVEYEQYRREKMKDMTKDELIEKFMQTKYDDL